MPVLVPILTKAIPWIGGTVLAWLSGWFDGEDKDLKEKTGGILTGGISTRQIFIIAAIILVIYLVFKKKGG